jgi:hypothetical protein
VQNGKKFHDIIFWCAALVLVNLPVLSLIRFLSDLAWAEAARPLLPSAPLLGCELLMFLLLKQYRGFRTSQYLYDHPIEAQGQVLTPAKP